VANHPLHSARLKLDRSAELLDQLDTAVLKLNEDPKPHTTPPALWEQEIDRLTGRVWFIVRLPYDPDPVDDRWGLLAGDAVHNARSALDHLACRLVEHNDEQVSIRTAFPVWSRKPSNRNERKRFSAAISGMSAPHKDSIRRLQPYEAPNSPEAAKLMKLAELDNLDKHQVLVPTVAIVASAHARNPVFHTDLPGQVDYRWNERVRARKGEEFFRFSPQSNVGAVRNIELDAPFVPTFGDLTTSVAQLRDIRDYVVGVVESFAPELR
jgi:hypothetical protein